jgi:hypothetical protein
MKNSFGTAWCWAMELSSNTHWKGEVTVVYSSIPVLLYENYGAILGKDSILKPALALDSLWLPYALLFELIVESMTMK